MAHYLLGAPVFPFINRNRNAQVLWGLTTTCLKSPVPSLTHCRGVMHDSHMCYIVITLLTESSSLSPLYHDLLVKRDYILVFFLFIFLTSDLAKCPTRSECTGNIPRRIEKHIADVGMRKSLNLRTFEDLYEGRIRNNDIDSVYKSQARLKHHLIFWSLSFPVLMNYHVP